MTHICVGNLTIIGRRQAIIKPNGGILLIKPMGTNLSEILIEIYTFSFKDLKIASGKEWPFCLELNLLSDGTKHMAIWTNEIHLATHI